MLYRLQPALWGFLIVLDEVLGLACRLSRSFEAALAWPYELYEQD